jgi:hypothetical protein
MEKLYSEYHSLRNVKLQGGSPDGFPGGFPLGFPGGFPGGYPGGFSGGFPGGFPGGSQKMNLKELHPDKCIPLIHWPVQLASCRKFNDF